MFVERQVCYSKCKQKNDVIQGVGQLGEKMSPGGKPTEQAFHPTKEVNKAEKLNYLSMNIAFYYKSAAIFCHQVAVWITDIFCDFYL